MEDMKRPLCSMKREPKLMATKDHCTLSWSRIYISVQNAELATPNPLERQ